jgi:hypothetical protein
VQSVYHAIFRQALISLESYKRMQSKWISFIPFGPTFGLESYQKTNRQHLHTRLSPADHTCFRQQPYPTNVPPETVFPQISQGNVIGTLECWDLFCGKPYSVPNAMARFANGYHLPGIRFPFACIEIDAKRSEYFIVEMAEKCYNCRRCLRFELIYI